MNKAKKERETFVCSVFALAKAAVTSRFTGDVTQLPHRSRIDRSRCQLGHPVHFMDTSLSSPDFHRDVILVWD